MSAALALSLLIQNSDTDRIVRKLTGARVSVDYNALPLAEFAAHAERCGRTSAPAPSEVACTRRCTRSSP
jgi:hypothetical protein